MLYDCFKCDVTFELDEPGVCPSCGGGLTCASLSVDWAEDGGPSRWDALDADDAADSTDSLRDQWILEGVNLRYPPVLRDVA